MTVTRTTTFGTTTGGYNSPFRIMIIAVIGAVMISTVTTRTTTTSGGVGVEAFNVFAPQQRQQLKSQILQLATEVDRGLAATPAQQVQMAELFERLERLNPTRRPLMSPLINGRWDLRYTTSDSILGRGGPRRVGPIIQNIDTVNLEAYNSEVLELLGGLVQVPRKVTATLTPQSSRLTNVQFEQFVIGPSDGLFCIKIDAPKQFTGSLDITYLDDTLRLTRGDKGNIFVLTKMET